MGKLAGLISSGIGLAIEAKSSYQPSQSGKTRDVSREVSYPDTTQVSRRRPRNESYSGNDEQSRRTYEDYQASHYDQMRTDVRRDEEYRRYLTTNAGENSQRNIYEKDIPFYAHERPIARNDQARGLPCPVIIPQRRPEDQSRGILRAYSSSLGDCGIDQDTFLDFLDAFNEAHKASPYLDVVNVAAQGAGFAPGIAPMVVSMVVPIAVRAAKGYQTNRQSSTFLDRANEELFKPHGLFAMILTYNPSQAQNPYGTPNEVQLPQSAPLIYPEDESRAQQTGFKKVGHFIADYGDRRAQSRYAYNNPSSGLASPAPTFKSRWGDPNHPGNNGGLKSLLTGIPDDKNERKEEKDDRKRDRKDRRRRGSSSSSSRSSSRGGLLSTALGAVSDGRGRGLDGRRPSLVGGVRGMINGPGNKDQSLIKGIKGIGMKTDILYLMITNNTSKPTPSPSRSLSPRANPNPNSNQNQYPPPPPPPAPQTHSQSHELGTYRHFLDTKASSPDQHSDAAFPIVYGGHTYLYQNNNPYRRNEFISASPPREASPRDVRDNGMLHDGGPPPAYTERSSSVLYGDRGRERERHRGNGEYCVPVL